MNCVARLHCVVVFCMQMYMYYVAIQHFVDSGMVLHILYRALLGIRLFGHWCPVIILRSLLWQASSFSIVAFGTDQLVQLYILNNTNVVLYIGTVCLLRIPAYFMKNRLVIDPPFCKNFIK